MRAVRCERQGPTEEMKLVELPDPVPAAGEAFEPFHDELPVFWCRLRERDARSLEQGIVP